MNRIIIHWTAGRYDPNITDLEHYHFLITGSGSCIKGKYIPEDNLNCADGKYAAHTGKGNTGSIGIAVCGMLGYYNKYNVGKYPLTPQQTEALFKKIAELCKQYHLPVTPETVLTHYEFNQKHNIKTGKIDITYLPSYPDVPFSAVGDFIRNKVVWYLSKLK